MKKEEWNFTQVFGDKQSMETANDDDVISALKFDKTGKFLGLGDKAGRLILFEENIIKGKTSEYQYLSELQSHVKEFDYLKSSDVEEKINQIEWLRPHGKSLFIFSTNDKTIKLWKVTDRGIKKPVKEKNSKELKLPKMEVIETAYVPNLNNSFPSLHTYLINSISVADNEEILISSDDLRVNLWNIEKPSQVFGCVDLKPDNLEDVSEVITCCKFHPKLDSLFLYATSKGYLKVCDLRKRGVYDNSALSFIEKSDDSQKNFFTDIVNSISDAIFSHDGNFIFTRDFLTTKVWDIRMSNKPISSLCLYSSLKSKLCELYENECIFDKFDISSSPCSKYYATGSFNSSFHIVDKNGETNKQYELNFRKKNIINTIPRNHYETLSSKYDYKKKTLKTSFHPKNNTLAVSCLNALFFYSNN